MTVVAQLAAPQVSWLAIGPELALAVGAALVLLVDVQFKPERARTLGWTMAGVLAAAMGLAVLLWARLGEITDRLPFGGMIIEDGYGLLARFVLITVTAVAVASGWGLFERLGRRRAEALALVLLSAAGFQIMAISVHLVMMFLGLEIGSIALYVLAGFTRERVDSDEAAMKYFLLGSAASAVFIYGVALTFAGSGSLNLLELSAFMEGNVLVRPAVLLIGLAMLIIGLTFKVSAAPFHAWAPDVYQGAPAGVVGYMAAAAKIGGFMALGRVLLDGFGSLSSTWAPVLAGIAALSMVVGSLFAIAQDDVRRLLAYSGVAHAGFILTGLLGGAAGARGMWFYLAVYTIQLVGAFGVVAAVSGSSGTRSSMAAFAGLSRRQPLLAGILATLLLGMAGLPLTSGFVAKFGVFRSAWQGGFEWLVIVAVLASVVAFSFYLRVIVVMYMQEPGEVEGDAGGEVAAPGRVIRGVLALAATATIVFGVWATPLLDLAEDAFGR
jgi:NADH-quinone oxidoreductase subunit N